MIIMEDKFTSHKVMALMLSGLNDCIEFLIIDGILLGITPFISKESHKMSFFDKNFSILTSTISHSILNSLSK